MLLTSILCYVSHPGKSLVPTLFNDLEITNLCVWAGMVTTNDTRDCAVLRARPISACSEKGLARKARGCEGVLSGLLVFQK